MARGESGRFLAGESGNPGGRPRIPPALRADLETGAEEAVRLLRDVIGRRCTGTLAMVRAAELLITRAYGRPGQELLGTLPVTVEGTLADDEQPDVRLRDALADALEAWADMHAAGDGSILLSSGLLSWAAWAALRDRVADRMLDLVASLVEAAAAEMPIAASIEPPPPPPPPPVFPSLPQPQPPPPIPDLRPDPPQPRRRSFSVDLSR